MPFCPSSEVLKYKMQLTVLLLWLFLFNSPIIKFRSSCFPFPKHSLTGRDCRCLISSKRERENGENKVLSSRDDYMCIITYTAISWHLQVLIMILNCFMAISVFGKGGGLYCQVFVIFTKVELQAPCKFVTFSKYYNLSMKRSFTCELTAVVK